MIFGEGAGMAVAVDDLVVEQEGEEVFVPLLGLGVGRGDGWEVGRPVLEGRVSVVVVSEALVQGVEWGQYDLG